MCLSTLNLYTTKVNGRTMTHLGNLNRLGDLSLRSGTEFGAENKSLWVILKKYGNNSSPTF